MSFRSLVKFSFHDVFHMGTYVLEDHLEKPFLAVALIWMAWRFYDIWFNTAEEDLMNVLGYERPPAPVVTLAAIKADGVQLRWKPPDPKSVTHYTFRLNGVDVGSIAPNESPATISNLKPGHFYLLNLVATNALGFTSSSSNVYFQTRSASTHDFFDPPAPDREQAPSPDDEAWYPAPKVQHHRVHRASLAVPSTAPAMVREHSGSQSQMHPKRNTPRRPSPAAGGEGHNSSDETWAEQDEQEGNLQQLTEKLEAYRLEIDEAESQMAEEEEDFQRQKLENTEKRDALKATVKERDDVSKELKRQVNKLERDVTAAQSRRSAQEKALQQKLNERNKIKEDIARWEAEVVEMHEDIEQMGSQKEKCETDTEEQVQELREKHAEELAVIKAMEDEVRQNSGRIKELEEEKQNFKNGADNNHQDEPVTPSLANEDRDWEEQLRNLQARYSAAYAAFQEAHLLMNTNRQRLEYLSQRRLSQTQFPFQGMQSRRNSARMQAGMPIIEGSATQYSSFPATTAPLHASGLTSLTNGTHAGFASTAGIFNFPPTFSRPEVLHETGMSQADIDVLTGGAPMSPTAGGLLPSGLLGDDLEDHEESETESESSEEPELPKDSPPKTEATIASPAGSVLTTVNPLPGLGAPQTLEQPTSPLSLNSPSPSLFSSPRESSNNLNQSNQVERVMDTDRRSIRSLSGSFRDMQPAPPQSTRFGSLFGFSRTRGKTLSEEGFAFGSLNKSQSHSMPRPMGGSADDPIGTARRRLSHSGGSWMDQMSSLVSRKLPEAGSPESSKHIATRRRAFNMFNPWSPTASDKPSSPRPTSIASFDNVLPRPSSESQRFGWPVSDTLGHRNSPLQADWGVQSTYSWSRHPSRRPSIQHGASSSFSEAIGLPPALDSLDVPRETTPPLAPIGTSRPTSSSAKKPVLNPAAPSFKSFFSSKSKASEKSEKDKTKKDKKKDKQKADEEPESRPTSSAPSSSHGPGTEYSESLHSDAPRSSLSHSLTASAVESLTESRDSLDRSISYTPSDSATPSSATPGLKEKESFMQKLTRKSSNTTFSFGSFKKDKGFFGKKTDLGLGVDEEEENTATPASRKSVDFSIFGSGSPLIGGSEKEDEKKGKARDKADGKENRSSGLSWSSFKKIGRGKDRGRGERDGEGGLVSGAETEATETGDEDDE